MYLNGANSGFEPELPIHIITLLSEMPVTPPTRWSYYSYVANIPSWHAQENFKFTLMCIVTIMPNPNCVVRKTRNWTLLWANWIRLTSSHVVPVNFVLELLRQVPPRPQGGVQIKMLCAYMIPTSHAEYATFHTTVLNHLSCLLRKVSMAVSKARWLFFSHT
jgi:hypothetical protein